MARGSGDDADGLLWTAAVKLRGLGEVLAMSTGEPPFGEEALKGLSYLLLEMADDLSAIRESLQAQPRRSKA